MNDTTESNVGLVFSDQFRQLVCCSPKFLERFSIVMDLINAYKLIKHLFRIPPLSTSSDEATVNTLKMFHTEDYIRALQSLQNAHRHNHTESEADESEFECFGLSYDCPGFPYVFDYALACVQGSLAAAEVLLQRKCQVAINWAGGWHHAKRSEAGGFCYLNDVVLAIHHLQTGFSQLCPGSSTRGLYIDLDLHHGDGVEEAFFYSPRVVTFSVHHASPGFFPGTGMNVSSGPEIVIPDGAGRGRFAAFNLPLADGTDDSTWTMAVLPVLALLQTVVRPAFVVVQCGADGLADDPHRIFNLTNVVPPDLNLVDIPDDDVGSSTDIGSYVHAVRLILSWKLPTLLLGGGGYNFTSTAKLWTVLTALAIVSTSKSELKLSGDIPEHSYLARYGPDFSLFVTSFPKIQRHQHQDICSHHARLLKQACRYAELNQLNYDESELEKMMHRMIYEFR